MRWVAIVVGAWLALALIFSLALCAAARRPLPKPGSSSAELGEAGPPAETAAGLSGRARRPGFRKTKASKRASVALG